MNYYPRYTYGGGGGGGDDDWLRPVAPEPTYSRPPSPRPDSSPIIPPPPSPGGILGGSPRLQPTTIYHDEHGNAYVWQHGSPWLPAGFIPLPPSPSMVTGPGFLPLPSPYASPRVSPTGGAVLPLHGVAAAPTQYYPANPQYPYVDPYYMQQGEHSKRS